MRFIVILLLLLTSAIIQTNIADFIAFYGVKPNLFIVIITCYSLLGGSFEGAVIGLLAGFIQDNINGTWIGAHTLLGMYLGIGVGMLSNRFVKDNIFVSAVTVFIATILYEAVFYFFALYIFGQTDILYAFRKNILLEAVYNIFCTFLLFSTILGIYRWIKNHMKVPKRY